MFSLTTKRLIRETYRFACGGVVAANIRASSGMSPTVYYGGARPGDSGGPLVKVMRLQKYFPDHCHGFNLVYLLSNATYLPDWAIDLLRRRNIPIAYNQNGVYYPGWYGGDWARENARMACSYQKADWVFYQSDFCRRAAAHFLGDRIRGGEVLYNAVDATHFAPRENWTAPSKPYTFLITGKIAPHLAYRIECAVLGLHYAVKEGLDARLRVAGIVDSHVLASVCRLRERLGMREDRVVFDGPYTQKNAPLVYQSADAYVMTKYNDPCPNAVLEALACGLPVLYSRSGGVPELVGECAGVGLPCPVDDWGESHVPLAEDVGAAMLLIAEDHAQMASQARERAIRYFDLPHWVERHRMVFASLLSGESIKEIS